MSSLRDQLHSTRAKHLATHYPGDLADLLPAATPRYSRWNLQRYRTPAGVAAAAMLLIVCSVVAQQATRHVDGRRWQAMLPSMSDWRMAPPRAEMNDAVKTITPPEVPNLLMQARQPLVSSGQFIVNIGKDVAHHADALFHMG